MVNNNVEVVDPMVVMALNAMMHMVMGDEEGKCETSPAFEWG